MRMSVFACVRGLAVTASETQIRMSCFSFHNDRIQLESLWQRSGLARACIKEVRKAKIGVMWNINHQ